MKIKSLVIFAVLATMLFCFSPVIKAQTADNTALIAQLTAEIQSLMQQINALIAQQGGGTTTSPGAWCHTFNSNLGFANSGSEEVTNLHIALKTENISYSPDNNTDYTQATSKGVMSFQSKYGINQTGYVGSLTRAKLNSLYGCSASSAGEGNICTPKWVCQYGSCINGYQSYGAVDLNNCGTDSGKPACNDFAQQRCDNYCAKDSDCPALGVACSLTYCPANKCVDNKCTIVDDAPPSISVLSPNGGESWQIGGTYTISYSLKNIPEDSNINIYLEKGYDTARAGVNSSLLIGTTTDKKSYSYTVPSLIATWPGVGSKYKIKVCSSTSCTYPDSSDAYFSISSASGFSGGGGNYCTPNWVCQWGSCVNGYKAYGAVDLNNCGVETNRPTCNAYAPEKCECNPPVECATPPQGCNYVNGTCSSCGTLSCTYPACTKDADCPIIGAVCGPSICPVSKCIDNQCTTVNNCTPNWVCQWGSCINGSQAYGPVDLNHCGGQSTINCTASVRSCGCTPNWTCVWGDCMSNGFLAYIPKDLNNCGTTVGQPECSTFAPQPCSLTHRECSNQHCIVVNGGGPDGCGADQDCITREDYACDQNSAQCILHGSGMPCDPTGDPNFCTQQYGLNSREKLLASIQVAIQNIIKEMAKLGK